MLTFLSTLNLGVLLHIAIVAVIGVRVIMMRPVPGVALAWLLLVTSLPFAGLALYLMFGERRLGKRRAARMAALRGPVESWREQLLADHMTQVDWDALPEACAAMDRLGRRADGIPTLVGGRLALFTDTQEALHTIIADIDRAQSTVHLQFYIWHPGGTADEVVDAVERAARRGVTCRVIVDCFGSSNWLAGPHPKRLREAGVEIVRALPTGFFAMLVRRRDLRNHRKIAVIDGEVAYTGSMNLVDPRHFKQGAGVGEWIDAMARVEGPVVEALNGVMLSDWFIETDTTIDELAQTGDMKRLVPVGCANVQVLSSGPAESDDAILQMILMTCYAAREELVITTPYFVPDDAMLRALRSAAGRGVDVKLIVPAKVDSFLVHHASRSYFADLMEMGVKVCLFEGGLLHTKSIVADRQIAMFGTVNLDMRSLWLNYEVSLFVYDADFGARLHELAEGYLDHAQLVDPDAWLTRPTTTRFVENAVRLVSPLL